jgi:glucosamine-6-phosphate deaminase
MQAMPTTIDLESHSDADEPYAALSSRVAAALRDQVVSNPRSVLALAAGRTPTGAYRLLSRWSKDGALDWRAIRCFGLDEYWDAGVGRSLRQYLEANLYQNINLPARSRFNPLFSNDYDGLVEREGGLDLTLLGIGKNGHIAFNEPSTPLLSWTHCVYLAESTRQANAELFGGSSRVPHRAVTMGIQTILASRKIILMVSGQEKRSILKRALSGPVDEDVPASFLQLHQNLTVMTDFAV